MLTPKHVRSIARRLGRLLTFDQALAAAQAILHSQGFGSGADTRSSGETAVFRLLTGGRPVLFDVGGHVGEYTSAFLKAHPAGRSYVFEPSDSHFRILSDRLGGRDNVVLVKSAVGACSGEGQLYKHGEISGLASLTKRRLDHFGIVMDRVETVSLQTSDEASAQHNVTVIDLLKIDVEGHELEVLKGASQAFRDQRIRLVQFEFGGTNLDTRTTLQDFFYFFQSFDFTIGLIQPAGKVQWLPKYDEFLEQYRTTNYLAAPRAIAGAASFA